MRIMQIRTADGWTTLGEVTTAGAEHLCRLTREGRNLYEADRPDSILLRQDGSDLYVSASFVRNSADWRVVDTKPAPVPANKAPKADDGDEGDATPDGGDESSDDGESTGGESHYDALKKAELQELCESRGLPKSGTNAQLIERLTEYDLEIA